MTRERLWREIEVAAQWRPLRLAWSFAAAVWLLWSVELVVRIAQEALA